jgi:hypothetical protein
MVLTGVGTDVGDCSRIESEMTKVQMIMVLTGVGAGVGDCSSDDEVR